MAICAALHTEGHAGRELKPCQLNQGAMVSTQQKAMAFLNSAPTTTDATSQTELWWQHAPTQVQAVGCALIFCQYGMAAVSTPVGSAPRQGNPPLSDRALGGGE